MRRVYLDSPRPERSELQHGNGHRRRALEAAGDAGYRRLVLDTFDKMQSAVRLYEKLGFRPIPAYYDNPIPGALYFELRMR